MRTCRRSRQSTRSWGRCGRTWRGIRRIGTCTGFCFFPRARRIRYTGVDLDGQPIDRTVSGFHARVVQHECDHLDGRLYPSRMTDLSTLGFVEEYARAAEAAAQAATPTTTEEATDDA